MSNRLLRSTIAACGIALISITAGPAMAHDTVTTPPVSFFADRAPAGNPVWITTFRFFSRIWGNTPDEVKAMMKTCGQDTVALGRTWEKGDRTVGLTFHHTPAVRVNPAIMDELEATRITASRLENSCKKIERIAGELIAKGEIIIQLELVEQEDGGKIRQVYLRHLPRATYEVLAR